MKEILTSYKFYLLIAALFLFYRAVNTADICMRIYLLKKMHVSEADDYPVCSLEDFFFR